MAITRIYAVKRNLIKKLENIMDRMKTDGGLLISSFDVVPETAYLQFEMTRDLSEMLRGEQRKQNSNLAHHIIQSFCIREITPERAHEIGKKLADNVLNSQYEYVLATHIDTEHIHNHIIFNAFSNVTYKKFNSDRKAYWKIRRISDGLCDQYGISVIESKRAF